MGNGRLERYVRHATVQEDYELDATYTEQDRYNDVRYITNFVDNVVKLLEVSADGIDFDWEHFSQDFNCQEIVASNRTRHGRIQGTARIMVLLRA